MIINFPTVAAEPEGTPTLKPENKRKAKIKIINHLFANLIPPM
jgi:hypothetical protein